MSETSQQQQHHHIHVPTADEFATAIRGIDAKHGAHNVPAKIMELGPDVGSALTPFAYLARRINPIDKEIGMRKYDHYSLMRALGFGATAGLMLTGVMRQELPSDDELADFWKIEGISLTNISKRNRVIQGSIGAPAREWLARGANAIITDSKERRWYPELQVWCWTC
jgi:hypothetical protein